MLIRSQDKKGIINFNNVENMQINKENEFYKIAAYFTENDMTTIGMYSTEEKAIKVLDMIQNCYYKNMYSNKSPIFQMPLDEKVKL